MSEPVSELAQLLRAMRPELHNGTYIYAVVPPSYDVGRLDVIGSFREAEGVTVILREEVALAAGLEVVFRAAWITLRVHSALHAVGLTAAFAAALGVARLSCNVVAGAHHDHLFVPVEDGPAALAVLLELQRRSALT